MIKLLDVKIFLSYFLSFGFAFGKNPSLYGKHGSHNLVIAEGAGVFDLDLDRFNYELYKSYPALFRENTFNTPHFQQITKDVAHINGWSSWSSRIVLFGSTVFPLATDNENTVIAAGLYGKGRILLGGNEDYFLSYQTDQGLVKLTQNAVQWLARADKLDGINIKTWGSDSVGKLPVNATGVSVAKLNTHTTQVYFIPMSAPFSEKDMSKLLTFVRNGGGLIVAGQVWAWLDGNGGENNALSQSGNRFIKKFGALMGSNVGAANALDGSLERNLYYALKSFSADKTARTDMALKALAQNAGFVLNFKTSKDPDFAILFKTAEKVYNGFPANSNKAVFCQLTASLLSLLLLKNPSSVKVAGDFKEFPGAVPKDAPRVTKTLTINGTYVGYPYEFLFSSPGSPLMVSTGLYAPPGDVVSVTVDPAFLATLPEDDIGIDIQVGVHTDTLYHKPDAKRSPQIVTTHRIYKSSKSLAANPWGGLIFIRVGYGRSYPMFGVTISNAVEAPHYVLGRDNLQDWTERIRNHPAPWGELEVPNQIVFSVPSWALRNYSNPEDFLTLFKGVMNEYNFLQGFEGDFRFRAERLAVDTTISAGWMHSGYPVMAFQTITDEIINPAFAREGKVWGEFHEFGHNSQMERYTTGDTTESGCNVYANYVNIHLFKAKTWFNPAANDANILEWLLSGKTGYSDHLAAISYNMLMVKYGYINWRNMNRFYFQNPSEVQGEKYDVFAYVMTKVMGMNLCPYFEFFTYQLTKRTLETCKALPDMPDLLIDKYAPVTANVPAPEGDCPTGWIQYGSSCFLFDGSQSLSWDEAESTCAKHGKDSHLASCLSAEETFFLTKHMRKTGMTGSYHIGIHEQNANNVPEFLDGSPLPNYMPWKEGHPIQDGNRCTKMEKGLLSDENCGNKAGRICKLGPTSCGSKITCPTGWIRFIDHCYWVYYGGKPYDVAKEDCQSKDAYIIEINSKDEWEFFDDLVKTVRWSDQYYWKSYWLGMENTNSWVSGEPVTFTSWCKGADLTANTGAVASIADTYCWLPLSKLDHNEAYVCEKSTIAAP